eukprot:CAMPEP_0171082644 /NCGR_PEP_ID=MMETSP0766_2-20121228/17234_1 /TAXON_ID=439317 /ORGANISM="Gambierdiscus australes, Strain CAWD 149" /LENGTH=509 /DNA_ID=CAMNT_0011540023 /DNA_START=74 /DNA_END=1603 /DNA_ORIENTATION=-
MGCGGSKKKQTSDAQSPTLQSLPTNNEDIRDKYELGAVLGSGSFGQVRQALVKDSPTQEVRAVKMIERDNEGGEWSNQAIFVREVGLLQQICHENIIRYYDFYEDVHFLYVVMELCRGGEVFAKIVELKRFSERNAARLGQQMFMAIDYIHKLHICHRDIKAENFMLAESSITSCVKMIDFGMACKFEDGKALTELCGSPHYLAPELIGQKYNHLVDVWACGVLMYLLMYGHYPYDAKQPRDIMVKILTEPIKWQTKVKLSRHGLDFLKRALVHDAKKRVSAEDILSHPWMQNANAPAAEDDVLPTEVIRSAHKKVTSTRKQVDPKIEKVRNEKLKKIDEEFNKGVRLGKRLGETPKEEYMSKPEFVRRETKITTAPSRDLNGRRTSLKNMLDGLAGTSTKVGAFDQVDADNTDVEASADKGVFGEVVVQSADNTTSTATTVTRRKGRAASCGVPPSPRRLSYIGALSAQDEQGLASLFAQKKQGKEFTGMAPETLLPGTSSAETDPLE